MDTNDFEYLKIESFSKAISCLGRIKPQIALDLQLVIVDK